MALVWPLAGHPINKNELIVWDLAHDPAELPSLDADTLRLRLFSKSDALPEGVTRLPVKTIHINKSPVVIANLKTLSPAMAQQWGQDVAQALTHADWARANTRALEAPWWPQTEAWLAESAAAIALAVNSAACLLDLENVIIDGSFSRALLAALQAALGCALDGYSWQGVSRPAVLPGTIGPDAQALGGALLPLHANFSPDRALFLKIAAG